MKLSVAIDEYTNRKRASGLIFRTEKVVLAGLNRQVNDLQLESLSTQHILNYLNSPTSSTRTWRGNYGILRHFFEFWSEQGAMPPLLMPQIRPPVRNSFVPYIYTRIQIRDLLKGVRKIGKTKLPKLDDETFRTILLVLYGTGAMTGEVFRLRCQDVDLTGLFSLVRFQLGQTFAEYLEATCNPNVVLVSLMLTFSLAEVASR